MAFSNQPGLPLPHGLGPKNGPNEGAPERTGQAGRGTTGRGTTGRRRDRRPPQRLDGDNFATISVRYRPYCTARRSPVGRTLRSPDWRKIRLPAYQKDFYREPTGDCTEIVGRSGSLSGKQTEITVTGRDAPKPILHVDEAGLPESVTKAIEKLNSGSSPTALQAQCWPAAFRGRDVVAIDCTASKWKSLAFLVPAIVHAQRQPSVLADQGTRGISADTDSGGGPAASSCCS
ncbi:hypothetical protein MTO96_007464 [Rhipicephalus appendiculatus]